MVPAASQAQDDCSRVVIFTLPGVTWDEIARYRPPHIESLIEEGAMGSMSVRTNSSRTSYASGFATIGAGTRMDGGTTTGGLLQPDDAAQLLQTDVAASGLSEIERLAKEDGYNAVPGALADGLGAIPAIAIGNAETYAPASAGQGFERWPVLAAMDPDGVVDLAAVGPILSTRLEPVHTDPVAMDSAIASAFQNAERATGTRCAVAVIDHGDLIRTELEAGAGGPADTDRREALHAADRLIGASLGHLTADDLVLVVSPTAPALDDDVHFGVAIATGPGFPARSLLSSASTRREGIVTLPDIAPTVLAHLGIERHPAMLGRAFFALDTERDRIAMTLEDDREAVFVDRVRTPITTVFVVAQVAIYLVIGWVLHRSERSGGSAGRIRWPETAALAVVAFPACTYLAGAVSQHAWGPWGHAGLLLALDIVVLTAVSLGFAHPLDRLLGLTALTCAVLLVDVITGGSLQVNTVFSYSPLVAGRFSGFGNTAFSVLGAATVVTGALIVQRAGRTRASLAAAAALFAIVVVADGAPTWGSDVGGVLALVPAFAITLYLLAGRRPTWRALVLSAGVTLAVLGLFLAFDLARPPDERTHLGRLFEDIRTRGGGVFLDTIGRKVETNLRVFTSTIWTYFVPPALAFIAWLLLRPKNRWEQLASRYPTVRAGLIGGLILSVLGFAVNDSGIVVPAMILSYLVPVALLAHLLLEREAK
jgi:hypothetical protein